MKKLTQRQLRKLVTREFKAVTQNLLENGEVQEQRRRRRRRRRSSEAEPASAPAASSSVNLDELDQNQLAARQRLAEILREFEKGESLNADRIGRALRDLEYLKKTDGISDARVPLALKRIRDAQRRLEQESGMESADVIASVEKSRDFYNQKGPQFKSSRDEDTEESWGDFMASIGGDPDSDPAETLGLDRDAMSPEAEAIFAASFEEEEDDDSGTQAARVELWNLPGDEKYEYTKIDNVWHARQKGRDNWLSLAADKYQGARSELDSKANRA